MNYYSVYLNLQGRRCVVIGGGAVAEGKIKGLLEAEAAVTLVSPRLTPGLKTLVDEGQIAHLRRSYQTGDLAGAFLVISVANDGRVKEQVWQEAIARGILINSVDDAPHCTFIAPAILRRGNLTIAISTGGRAPALAVRLRDKLACLIGDEYARFLELAGALRGRLLAHYPDFEQRRALWYQLVDSEVLDLLRQDNEAAARRRIGEILNVAADEF